MHITFNLKHTNTKYTLYLHCLYKTADNVNRILYFIVFLSFFNHFAEIIPTKYANYPTGQVFISFSRCFKEAFYETDHSLPTQVSF